MPIKVLISKAEYDSLTDAVKALYVEKDGKFALDTEGGEDVAGLKSALEKERESAKTLTKELSKLRADLAGTDPAKAKAAIARLQQLEDQELIAKGEVETLIKKRIEAFEGEKNKEISTRDEQITGLNGRLSELLIDNELRKVAANVKVQKTAIDDFVARGQRLYKLKDGKAVPLNGEEIVFSKKKANEPMPMEEWASDLVTSAPHLFEGSGGGAASQGGGGGGKAHTITRTEAREPGRYAQAKEAAQKAGQELQIVE